MSTAVFVLLLALLPGAGNVLGSVAATWLKPPRWVVGVVLHGAAGIAIAIVAVELMPRALADTRSLYIALAFIAGALVSILIAELIGRFRTGDRGAGPWMVVAAVGVDLATDGFLTGAGTSVASSLGILLAASQVIGNIPTGFAAAANLQDTGKATRWTTILLLPLIAPLFAAVSYFGFSGVSAEMQALVLAFMAGILLLATIEDTVSEGDAPDPPRRWTSISFALGFGLMMFASQSLQSGSS